MLGAHPDEKGSAMRRSLPSRFGLGAVFLLIAMTAARAADQDKSDSAKAAAPKVGMANPAAVFCGERGGKVVIETAGDGGQSGFCVFPDGTRVNEWAYFRSNHRTTH
jgi:putative hemolysin